VLLNEPQINEWTFKSKKYIPTKFVQYYYANHKEGGQVCELTLPSKDVWPRGKGGFSLHIQEFFFYTSVIAMFKAYPWGTFSNTFILNTIFTHITFSFICVLPLFLSRNYRF
jgi:hypothetical protein